MKKLFSALLAVLIFAGVLCPAALASGAPETDTSLVNSVHGVPILEPPGEDDVIDFSRFEGKSLEEIMDEFLQSSGVDPDTLSFGFCNTVTGEEYYHNGDKYMVAASVYKLPLNMYYSEKVYLGEMDWMTKFGNITYESIQVSSIVSSNNELSEMLQNAIGDYRTYRTAIAPYLGVNTHTVEERYYEDNSFTSRQIISALKELYTNKERYPRVISYMLLGAPNNYFAYSEHRYEIAHKYGYLTYEGHNIFNDAAIVYTPDPILLVMFTDNCYRAIPNMTAFCTLMCDYSEYTRQLREQAQAEESPEPTAAPEPEPTAAPEASPAPTPTPAPTPVPTVTPVVSPEPEKESFELNKMHKLIIAAAAAGLLSLVFFRIKRLRPFSKVLAVILLMAFGVAAVALATLAVGNAINGTLFPEKPEETPAPSISEAPTVENVTPAPTATPSVTEYVVTDESPEEILALADIESLRYVDGRGSGEYAALSELGRLLPQCRVDYTVELYGLSVASDAAELRIEDFSITDPEPLMEKLSYLPALERLDIRELWFSNETVEALMERYPELDIVWTVNAGKWHISSEATCFSTRQNDSPAQRYTSEDFAPIFKHCRELVALDLSHNALSSLEGIENLQKLKVLLLGDNPDISDISPLAALGELEYLELYKASALDFSPLAGLEKLTDINLSYCRGLSDCSFMDSLPGLERAWLRGSSIAPPDWNSVISEYPDVKILFWHESGAATAGGWNGSERSLAISKAFRNWDYVSDFVSWDNIVYRDGADLN